MCITEYGDIFYFTNIYIQLSRLCWVWLLNIHLFKWFTIFFSIIFLQVHLLTFSFLFFLNNFLRFRSWLVHDFLSLLLYFPSILTDIINSDGWILKLWSLLLLFFSVKQPTLDPFDMIDYVLPLLWRNVLILFILQ